MQVSCSLGLQEYTEIGYTWQAKPPHGEQGVTGVLTRTFCHLQGVGPVTERRLWQEGIDTWDAFLQCPPQWMPPARRVLLAEELQRSRQQLAAGNSGFFFARLPAHQHWRLFATFGAQATFVDIETTGLDRLADEITAISVYSPDGLQVFVQGRNLETLPDCLRTAQVLVSYNGKAFDVPFIERCFATRLTRSHIDLRYILHGLGLRGGLKGCERALGIDRGACAGIDGLLAVRLWHAYVQTHAPAALETLLAYNVEDTLNLRLLMALAYNRMLRSTPFADTLEVPIPDPVANPYAVDSTLLAQLRCAGG